MKKNNFFLVAAIMFCWFIAGFLVWWSWVRKPVCYFVTSRKECSEILFSIEKGEGVEKIASRLEGRGLIKSALAFKILSLQKRIVRNIQAGDFYLSPADSLLTIALSLTRGATDKKVTVVEGWRMEEIGEYLLKQGIEIDLKQWRKLISQKELEGYLFPDTYMIPKTVAIEKLVDIFVKNFNKKFTKELEEKALSQGIDKQSILILASIIEREARHDEDRPVVAGILLKRLAADWPLQVDASIQYAVASNKCSSFLLGCEWWPKKLSEQDLNIKSAYNTYLHKGLPPGPICSPSLSAIKSVIFPKESSYWYYLSDLAGTIHYAETGNDHVLNVQKFLRN